MASETNNLDISEKLDHYVKCISNVIKVDQIILFGSYAKNSAHEYSDIDVAVISPELDKNKSRYENVREIKRRTKLLEPGLQLFAFSTETFNNEEGIQRLFIREIKKTGKVIYKKPD